MSKVIVAFSVKQNAVNIRNILVRAGIETAAVCVTGAKVLQYAELWSEGIVVCGMRLQDMHYMQLRELLPEGYGLLLLAPSQNWMGEQPEGIVCLPSPPKVRDLLDTVGMLCSVREREQSRKKDSGRKRSQSERRDIDRAKALLMERNGMSEEEAHRYLQKTSMQSGTNMAETIQMILRMMDT